MIEFLYLGSYTLDQEALQWSLHVKVATIADKYDLKPLEKLAYDMIEKKQFNLRDDKDFAAAAKWTYENAKVDGSGRETLVKVAVKHLKTLLKSEDFSSVVAEIAELGRDILIADQVATEKACRLAVYRCMCVSCDLIWTTSDPDSRLECPTCHSSGSAYMQCLYYRWDCQSCGDSIRSNNRPTFGSDHESSCPRCG